MVPLSATSTGSTWKGLAIVAFEFGSRLTEIEAYEFCICFSLRSICIPSSVAILCENCFIECTSLCSLTFEFGSKLTQIQHRALSGCTSLRALYCPRLLQEIDGSSLLFTGISEIILDPDNQNLSIAGGLLVGVDTRGKLVSAIRYQGSGSLLLLPRDTEIIGPSCFACTRSLRSLTFESGSQLQEIEREAFMLCLSLQSICIPASVKVIAHKCFLGCRSLKEVRFEPGSALKAIARRSFQGCSSLQSVCLPASVEVMGKKCFSSCTALSSVTFESDSRLIRIEHNAFYNCSSLQSISIPESVEMLAPFCFSGCPISSWRFLRLRFWWVYKNTRLIFDISMVLLIVICVIKRQSNS
jgi:hypothetical protein